MVVCQVLPSGQIPLTLKVIVDPFGVCCGLGALLGTLGLLGPVWDFWIASWLNPGLKWLFSLSFLVLGVNFTEFYLCFARS